MKDCCYCKKTFEDDLCRPYGIDGADTCFPCAMKPENKDLTDKMCFAAIDRAVELGKGAIYIGHHSGPLPASVGGGEEN